MLSMQFVSLYSFNSHISVVVCCFFEFGMFSYLVGYIREWVKVSHLPKLQNLILALSKLKADLYPAADNYFKIDLAQTKRFFFDNVEKKKMWKKGEIAGLDLPAISPFLTMFTNNFSPKVVKG